MRFLRYVSVLLLVIVLPNWVMAQQIVFTPKWMAQAQFTGYYVADKMGFYKDEGLDVRIEHPSPSESSFPFLETGRAQVVVMNLSYALMARAEGASLINIMQTSQENSLRFISRTPLHGLEALRHRKIAMWNHLSEELLDQFNRYFGLEAEWIRFNSGVNVFLSGAVDICLVGSYNEFLQLSECGMEVDSSHVLNFADFGYNLPEDGLYVTEEFYREHTDLVDKFVRASIRGWKWVNEHREKALDIVMEQIRLNNIGTNRYHQRRMLEEILRLQVDKSCGERTFHLSKQSFDCAVKILLSTSDLVSYEDFVK